MAAIIFNAQYRTFNIAPFNSVFKEALLQKKKNNNDAFFFGCCSWNLGRHDISHHGTARDTIEGIEHRKLLKPNKQIIVIPIISLWLTIE